VNNECRIFTIVEAETVEHFKVMERLNETAEPVPNLTGRFAERPEASVFCPSSVH